MPAGAFLRARSEDEPRRGPRADSTCAPSARGPAGGDAGLVSPPSPEVPLIHRRFSLPFTAYLRYGCVVRSLSRTPAVSQHAKRLIRGADDRSEAGGV